MSPESLPLMRHLAKVKDFRRPNHNTKKHKLVDILFIAVCSALCGIDEFEYMALWAKSQEAWLGKLIELPFGIPSHNTFNRVFARMDAKVFEQSFLAWVKDIVELLPGEIISIDGKSLRASFDKATAKTPLHMVSAWASANKVVLAQLSVEEKSNEITAIPKLLAALDIKACLITIDAMGTQREIAGQIIAAEADYTLALKGNQPSLHADVIEMFNAVAPSTFDDQQRVSGVEHKHGRDTLREYYLINNVDVLQNKHMWPGLASVGLARSITFSNGKASIEERYYVNSFRGDIKKFAQAVRGHWAIEAMHWCLDVSLFNEDKCRVRKENAAENLAVLRHMALNLHKKDPEKGSMRAKKIKCIFDPNRILKTLSL